MQIHCRRARVQGGDGFSLAECGSLSLAGLLLGEEKIFLSPTGVCRISLSQLELVNGGK